MIHILTNNSNNNHIIHKPTRSNIVSNMSFIHKSHGIRSICLWQLYISDYTCSAAMNYLYVNSKLICLNLPNCQLHANFQLLCEFSWSIVIVRVISIIILRFTFLAWATRWWFFAFQYCQFAEIDLHELYSVQKLLLRFMRSCTFGMIFR